MRQESAIRCEEKHGGETIITNLQINHFLKTLSENDHVGIRDIKFILSVLSSLCKEGRITLNKLLDARKMQIFFADRVKQTEEEHGLNWYHEYETNFDHHIASAMWDVRHYAKNKKRGVGPTAAFAAILDQVAEKIE